MIAIFIYNILLIVLYTITMSFAISYYLKDKNKLYLMISFYLAFFIFDNVIIYMTEFINTFASRYNEVFMTVPIAKTIIFLANCFFSIWIAANILKEKVKPLHYGLLIIMAIWLTSIPLLENSAFKVWLYYLPNQLILFYLGIYLWQTAKKKQDLSQVAAKYSKWLAVINLLFSIAILLEDTFVIFNIDQYTSLAIKINNRNICEDIFSIIICILILNYFLRDRQLLPKTPTPREQAEKREAQCFQQFCDAHQFTQREVEIFQLLLEHKQNQEIADTLFLSIGTVKTHVHNIFVKLNIKKRTQIAPLYESFKGDFSQKIPEAS